jgi:hypothetical protein
VGRQITAGTDRNLDPCRFETLDSAPGHARVRVIHSRHHTRDARFDQRIGARRRLAMVGAGFECDISGRPFGGCAGARKRFALSVGPSAQLSPAAPDNAPSTHKDAADGRIWPYGTQPALGQRQRPSHVTHI